MVFGGKQAQRSPKRKIRTCVLVIVVFKGKH